MPCRLSGDAEPECSEEPYGPDADNPAGKLGALWSPARDVLSTLIFHRFLVGILSILSSDRGGLDSWNAFRLLVRPKGVFFVCRSGGFPGALGIAMVEMTLMMLCFDAMTE